MPLKRGKSKASIRYNTEMLIDEGRDPKQAYAIANDVARRKKKAKKGRMKH